MLGKTRPVAPHDAEFETPFPISVRSKHQRLKWISHRAHSARFGRPKQGLEDRRKHVGVLVRIKMGDAKSSRLQLANLGGDLGFNLLGIQTSCRSATGE